MKLSQIRALLKQHGYKTTAEINRIDVKRAFGKVTGVDVMLTDGTVAFLPTTESTAGDEISMLTSGVGQAVTEIAKLPE